ncbi:MAG: DegT/DnrJ/EryC1/StrS family aminotransferase [Nitrospirae bacterium]|nr:MAG: DegT/DnrJ/EryC1/StrS family aminotransferase [Nitrospirota bacterium]
MSVPFLDLKLQYHHIKPEMMAAIQAVCDEQAFILGPRVEQVEQALAAYLGCPYAIGVASGSDALLLALMASGVRPGDEVLTTPFTFFSTAGVISRLQATPVFVDISPDTFTLNPDLVESRLTSRARAIIPVHLFGQCAEMERIGTIARKRGLIVIEDACQAIGASRHGQKAGTFGDFGCFSFFPSKNLGGIGDGGLITTHSAKARDLLLALRVHGSRSDYHHDHIGINSRLDALQAAVLLVKLRYLDSWNARRQENACLYNQLFQEAGLLDRIILPKTAPGNVHVFHQYTIRAAKRDQLMAYLKEQGIGHKVYYPVPLHLQECYHFLGYQKGDFPVSELMAQEVLSLPIFPELTKAQIVRVVETIAEFYRTN